MAEDVIEVPQWVVSKIGSLSLENEILRQENAALKEYIKNNLSEGEDNDD